MPRVARLTVAALTFAAATVVPLAVAVPAHADFGSCVGYLHDHDVRGGLAEVACAVGSTGDVQQCQEILTNNGVPDDVAEEGCGRAAEEG